MDDAAISPFRISLAIVIAFIIIVPASFMFISRNEALPAGLRADGDFSDWDHALRFADPDQYPAAGLDIAECAVGTNDAGALFMYARARGNWFSGQGAESLMAFIDSDGNPDTGYCIRGIGAEFAVDVYGWGGAKRGQQLGVWSGQDRLNWSAWSWRGVSAACSLTEIGAGIPGQSIQLQPAHSILFLTKAGAELADMCDAAVGVGRGALTLTQMPGGQAGIIGSDQVMTLELEAYGEAVEVTAIDFGYSGLPEPSVNGLPATVQPGTPVTLTVTSPVAALANGTFLTMEASTVTCSGTVSILGSRLAAYAHAAPRGIRVDGAFADWAGVVKSQEAGAQANADIDIAGHASVNGTAEAFFYMGLAPGGRMFGGSSVPTARAVPGTPGEPGEPGTPSPLPRISGEDVARIYIDTIPGGQMAHGMLADYVIEMKGREGIIMSRQLFSLPGRTFVSNIDAAACGGELEVGLVLSDIGFSGTLTYAMEATDWQGRDDGTAPGQAQTLNTTTRSGYIPERPTATFTVGAGLPYTSIQDAIDDAAPGDTILVWEGSYIEDIIIYKELTVTGNGSAYTDIVGSADSKPVTITASNTDFSGFTVSGSNGDNDILLSGVTGCRIHNNSVYGCYEGITLETSSSNTIEYNLCPSLLWSGIVLRNSDGNTVRNNAVTGNGQGIYLEASSSNTIRANNITDGTDGIVVDQFSDLNQVTFNGVNDNIGTGILLFDADGCTVNENTVSNNYNGIYIDTGTGNTVFHNNLFANTVHATDVVPNAWDDGTEGNYWDDYTGTDSGGDGIGDTPYTDIDGGAGAQDNYPLMDPWMPEVQGLSPHGTIRIDQDADFTAANGVVNAATGDGSSGNPWIISGWNIEGIGDGFGIYIGNTTEYFLVQDCLVHDITGGTGSNEPYDVNAGITLYNVQNGVLSNVTATDGDLGIYIRGSPGISVLGSNASGNSAYGVQLFASDGCSVEDSAMDSNYYGLHVYDSDTCIVASNNLTENDVGIYLYIVTNSLATGNVIDMNSLGMWVRSCNGVGIYNNRFIGNTVQASDDGSNSWDNGYPAGGNYWSDYSGADAYSGPLQDQPGSDGIGDTPYTFTTGQDDYPIVLDIPEFGTVLVPVALCVLLAALCRAWRRSRDE